ncbi:tetratricopeptide repeat protein [Rhodanobacter sp. 115]|uniref:tetratricopeptide repeat protein n=1 Tax=Rhodanobacter sp. FW021-MT20 TaxID=1162282 RepID=UPI000307849B|nr:tetratricopeptide repeat protein [Rhodanobacter sp. 115]
MTGLAYAPGLHGGFLFDDFANLPVLGATGPIDHWATFWRYITSGTADPTGRPLTLLSFLLDAHNWPADPYPFKRTSLILHLLNAVLLYALLTKLGRSLDLDERRRKLAALLGSTLWLLHPLLVSTTLYIVQREAMLPATCVMAGLMLWLHGRQHLEAGKIKTGLGWSVLGLGGFTVLGVLSKANGALLPLYALLIEIIVLAPRRPLPDGNTRRTHRAVMLMFGIIPATAIGIYLAYIGVHGIVLGGVEDGRSWSIGQRLLTEPRVLMDYLKLLWLPRPFSSGLFNDQYAASSSWLHPATTLPSLLAIVALIAGAWHWRRRHPALALAVVFYFVGQLLESSSIPLELYFEHRNYVPALLMFWPLGLWLADTRTLRLPKYALMLVLLLTLAWMTHARAEVWGNVQTQALVWATINPDSPRAQANAAQVEAQTGHPRAAVRRLQVMLASQPDQVQLALNLIGARCESGGVSPANLTTAQQAMRNSSPNIGPLFAHWFERMLPVAMADRCPGLTSTALLSLVNAGLQNPNLSAAGPQQSLTYLRGRIALAQHQPDIALTDFTRALSLQVYPGMALEAAATLGSHGYPVQGLQMLDYYQQVQSKTMPPSFGMPMVHTWVMARENYWPHELAHLRHQLSLDAKADSTNTAPSDSARSTPS